MDFSSNMPRVLIGKSTVSSFTKGIGKIEVHMQMSENGSVPTSTIANKSTENGLHS